MSSLALEYSSHRSRDCRSIGLSFQRLVGSSRRRWKRRSCSSSLTENQYLIRMIPERISMFSNCGQERKNSSTSSSVQKPITRSTPARLYQLRSNSTISPAAGSWAAYRWKYHWLRSRSVGVPSATTRQIRGFRLSVIRLMVPPLPAASRPSNSTTTRSPACLVHSWSLTSSTWSPASSRAYSFPPILPGTPGAASAGCGSFARLGGLALRHGDPHHLINLPHRIIDPRSLALSISRFPIVVVIETAVGAGGGRGARDALRTAHLHQRGRQAGLGHPGGGRRGQGIRRVLGRGDQTGRAARRGPVAAGRGGQERPRP